MASQSFSPPAGVAASVWSCPSLLRGVLSMLDEECLLPHGTDSGFVALLQSQTQVIAILLVFRSSRVKLLVVLCTV